MSKTKSSTDAKPDADGVARALRHATEFKERERPGSGITFFHDPEV